MKTLIMVTHLLGTGHLSRALILARAFVAAGHDVRLVSGGRPASHLDTTDVGFVQLPPLQSDGVNFTHLLDEMGDPATDALHEARRGMLKQIMAGFAPDLVITELYPFGRRSLAAEFQIVLAAAAAQAPRPVVCASVRDILAPPSKPAKARAASDIIRQCYDAVLVHSDPALVPLEASWPVPPDLGTKLHYTGFVAAAPAPVLPDARGAGHVLVSAGGGDVGGALFATVIHAARQTPDLKWCLLVGGATAPQVIAKLQQDAPPGVEVMATTPDFRQMLHHAAASVSLCGYNTALDVLQAGTPAVFVPFDAGGEVEQSLRAAALSKLDGVAVLKTRDLTAQTLTNALRHVMAQPRRADTSIAMNGAARSVKIATELVKGARNAG